MISGIIYKPLRNTLLEFPKTGARILSAKRNLGVSPKRSKGIVYDVALKKRG